MFSFADLEQQGRDVVEQAEARANEILRAAEQQGRELAERHKRSGYEEGFARGRAEALEQTRAVARADAVAKAREQVEFLVRSLAAVLTEFEENKRALIAAAESGMIELALAVARRVCKLETGASTAAAQANARCVLEMVQGTGDAELHVHPDEYEQVRELAPELLTRADRLEHVKFVADESVERGGCTLTTRTGEVDATLETQLDRIAAALRTDAAHTQPREN